MKPVLLLIILVNVFCYFSTSVFAFDAEVDVVVHTNNGPVHGLPLNTLFENKPYIAFRGIPYAEPPLGDLRFKVNVKTIIYLVF